MKRYSVQHTTQKIKDNEIVKDWLTDLSPGAKRTYLSTLAEFCQITNHTPIELLTIARQEKKEDRATWERETIQWFKKYDQHSIDYNRARETYKSRLIIIKSFFNFYEVQLPSEKKKKRRKTTKKFKVKNRRPGLTREQIQTTLKASKWSRLRAMILSQCSSGLAITDIIHLTLKEYKKGLISIGEDKYICQLFFEEGRQKGEKQFYTFLSFEAVTEIELYLRTERPKHYTTPYLFTALYHDAGLTEGAFQVELRRLNHKLGLKAREKGLHRPITSHMFRKWFYTQLSNAGMPYEVRKHLMGHVMPTKVDDSYYLDNPDELRDKYIEYMPELLISKYESVNITNMDDKLLELESKYDELHRRLLERDRRDLEQKRKS